MNYIDNNSKGFTLIELLVVIAIIGTLASVVLASLNTARDKARDATRLAGIHQIQRALQLYWLENDGNYPQENSSNGSWEDSTEDGGDFLDELVDGGYLPSAILDPINASNFKYSYYVYGAGSYACPSNRGQFYVLGARDMESSGRPHPLSPGWSCPSRNWQNEFDWVTGNFEN